MDLHMYRYGEGARFEGLCVGVARHPPPGIPRACRAVRGYFDVWLPRLAPSRELVEAFRGETISFKTFAARYRREMRHPDARHLITFLGTLAQRQPINLGCFCVDATRCHRSVLADLIARTSVADRPRPPNSGTTDSPIRKYASPPCSMPEIPD